MTSWELFQFTIVTSSFFYPSPSCQFECDSVCNVIVEEWSIVSARLLADFWTLLGKEFHIAKKRYDCRKSNCSKWEGAITICLYLFSECELCCSLKIQICNKVCFSLNVWAVIYCCDKFVKVSEGVWKMKSLSWMCSHSNYAILRFGWRLCVLNLLRLSYFESNHFFYGPISLCNA